VDEKAKVNAGYYITKLLPKLKKDCRQDGASAHTAALAQDWIKKKCPGFNGKSDWPPNSLPGHYSTIHKLHSTGT